MLPLRCTSPGSVDPASWLTASSTRSAVTSRQLQHQLTNTADAIGRRYVDFPITDVLQMMGRAGRPQYDQHGVAVIMVADTKKSFYKKVRSILMGAVRLFRSRACAGAST